MPMGKSLGTVDGQEVCGWYPLGTNDVMMFINQFVPGRVSHVQIKFNHLIGIW